MHRPEPLAFVSEIEHPIIVGFGAATRMTLLQAAEAFTEFVAHFDHEAPQGGDAIQFGLLSGAPGDELVDRQEFDFKLPCLLVKRGAKVLVDDYAGGSCQAPRDYGRLPGMYD
jgi:hypothetical protein